MADNTFAVDRRDIRRVRPYNDHSATADLAEGQARLKVGPVALTANNVTYAQLGDALNYFDFFPSTEPSQGRLPAWGFGDVVESKAAGVNVGERVYGYFPISSHLILEPVGVGADGFTDGAAHRTGRAPFYNRYSRVDHDSLYAQAHEAQLALLRPLFTTAFLIDDHIASESRFGATQIVLASASSKTAYATAFCLAKRGDARVIGLTSERNRAFVEGLGCYDVVVTYAAAETLPDGPTMLVDMAGDAAVRSVVHHRYGDALKQSLLVGATHWDAAGSEQELPGVKPTWFFAPAIAQDRVKQWGPAGFAERIGRAWASFMEPVCAPESAWLRVVAHQGLDAALEVYRGLLDGEIVPNEGHVVRV
ncbi:DUF2855 family protein [Enhygromyxa salina]|uniref:DUF2855 domain-containing protein n=1 Tax=Enhygromyxa salina TaxID=215803 RepID=A0A2S9YNJ0_9BACT|nr:DUF2855 family protein [Enhygromyxa salina]PRQ06656.1 hypothetical protein ENSA7_35320 [Enhygromyxa salina]